MGERLDIAVAGDCLMTRRVSRTKGEGLLRVRRLLRQADVAFGNCEISFPSPSTLKTPDPATLFPLAAPPVVAAELAWMGFGLMSMANNHVADYGPAAILETKRRLNDAGILTAGAGENRSQAASATFLLCPAGRIGLIACATTRTDASSGKKHRGKPGVVNHLRVVGDGGLETAGPSSRRILAETRFAAEQASVVLVSVHSHESGTSQGAPPDFLVRFSRECVDCGASAVLVHGPHTVRGTEIYDGKPIMYGLGSMFFQPESVSHLPRQTARSLQLDARESASITRGLRQWLDRSELWQGAMGMLRYDDGTLSRLEIHPLVLWSGRAGEHRGSPQSGNDAARTAVLELIRSRCEELGTEVRQGDDVAIVPIG